MSINGVRLIIGRLVSEDKSVVQAVLFDSTKWGEAEASSWLKNNDFQTDDLDKANGELRFRQRSPKDFQKETLRTIGVAASANSAHGGGGGKKKKRRVRLQDSGGIEPNTPRRYNLAEVVDSPDNFVYSTSEDSFHFHEFNPTDAFTAIPRGLFTGHRHEILRNADGQITGFGESAGHGHALPDFIEDRILTSNEIALLYKEKEYDDLFSVKGIEIFRIGTWNGDTYSRSDLDEMVRNFKKVGFQVPIKLGHKESSGAPAFGWIESIRRAGDVLIADFKDLSEKLWQAIKDRRFDSVSSEVFWDLERDGQTYHRVLKAVALLGAETPAVSGLAPLRTVVNSIEMSDMMFDRVGTYSFNLGEEEVDMDKLKELEDRVRKLQEQFDAAEVALAKAEETAESSTKGAKAEEAAAALKEAQDTVTQLQTDLAKAQNEIKTLAKDQNDVIAKQGEEIVDLRKTVDSLTGRLGTMAEDQRQEHIRKKVDEVPIPALRKFISPLYDLATSTAKTVMFTEKTDEDPKETKIEDVLDLFVAHLRSDASKLFTELAEHQLKEREDGNDLHGTFNGDPSAEADSRARKYMDGNKDIKYADAVKHVLKEDPALNTAYAEFTSSPKN